MSLACDQAVSSTAVVWVRERNDVGEPGGYVVYTWIKWGRKWKYGKSTTAGCKPVYTDVSLRKDRSTVALKVDDGTYHGRGDQVGVPSAGGDFDVIIAIFLQCCLTKDMTENAIMRSRCGCAVDVCAVADGERLGHTDIWKRAQTGGFVT